jgi:RNA polymerase sigma-70 factor (ECF subfamily)
MGPMARDASETENRQDAASVVVLHPLVRTETAAFEPVYLRHHADVFRYLLVLTHSAEEAEDLCAETFERALRAWPDHDALRTRPLPWLLLTARRIATDRWRRARRLLGLLPLVDRRDGDASLHATSEFWLWFDAVAEVLTDRQREVLVLRYRRDLSDEEIGHVMNLSASGVRTLAARALDVLRNHPELL